MDYVALFVDRVFQFNVGVDAAQHALFQRTAAQLFGLALGALGAEGEGEILVRSHGEYGELFPRRRLHLDLQEADS